MAAGASRLPGAPRALVEKINMYRGNASARRELYLRARQYQQVGKGGGRCLKRTPC